MIGMTLSAPGVTVDFPTQMHELTTRQVKLGLAMYGLSPCSRLSPKNVLTGKVAVSTFLLLVRKANFKGDHQRKVQR